MEILRSMQVVQIRSTEKVEQIDFSHFPLFDPSVFIDSLAITPRTLLCAIEEKKAIGFAAISIDASNSISLVLQVAPNNSDAKTIAALMASASIEWLEQLPQSSFGFSV